MAAFGFKVFKKVLKKKMKVCSQLMLDELLKGMILHRFCLKNWQNSLKAIVFFITFAEDP
jgi:hypothetical protein